MIHDKKHMLSNLDKEKLDGCTEYQDGKIWHLNGVMHREDGPAIMWNDGSQFWRLHGKWHREGGPASEFTDGHKIWAFNGLRHRLDGPAEIFSDGSMRWWKNDVNYTKEEFDRGITKYEVKVDTIVVKG